MLDQLPADERPHVGVVEQCVQGQAQALGRAGIGRDGDGPGLAGKQALFGRGLLAGVRLHGQQVQALVGGGGEARCAPAEVLLGQLGVRKGPAPAGEDAGHRHHIGVAVGLDGLATRVKHRAAVGVELLQADAVELHHLTRKVLVGQQAGAGVLFAVAQVRQVDAGGRVERHVLQQLAEVAKGVLVELVHVLPISAGVVPQVGVRLRHHQDLVQRKGHALA